MCTADGPVNSEHPATTPSVPGWKPRGLGQCSNECGQLLVLVFRLAAVGTNYVANSNSAAFTINKADPVVTAVGGTFGYDGNSTRRQWLCEGRSGCGPHTHRVNVGIQHQIRRRAIC